MKRLVLFVVLGCGSDPDAGVSAEDASIEECPSGGGAILSDGVRRPICNGASEGLPGPAGPRGAPGAPGPAGSVGPAGPSGEGLGAISAVTLCSRFEDGTNFSYSASLYEFSSGITFADLTFDTPILSGATSRFFPPGSNPSALFIDGLDASTARLSGLFVQTANLSTRRWSMSQDSVLYFDTPFSNAAFCATSSP